MPPRALTTALFLLFTLLLPFGVAAGEVKTGAERLRDGGFARLKGLKYGLVTNQTATVAGRHLLDLLRGADVPPAVIFVPEHGLRGTEEDGVHIRDGMEGSIPVRSLYGGLRKPRREELAQLDLLVFDIQDIGARFYTYISTLGLVMQAAAEAGTPLLVLDRPNPLGGEYVSGFVSNISPAPFTCLYPVPVAHGMTVGELAYMIRDESLLPGLDDLRLSVLEMSGWQRWMRWPDTGLSWTATSPNIPDFETALLYAGIGLLEGTGANEGRGTDRPFRLVGMPETDGGKLAVKLAREGLPGVEFRETRFTPRRIPGRSSAPKHRGRELGGVQIAVKEYGEVLPVETGVAVLVALYESMGEPERKRFFRPGFRELAGTAHLRAAVEQGMAVKEVTALWRDDVEQFLARRRPYLLY